MAFINRLLGGGGSEGTAIRPDVLAGKTFSNDADAGLIGTMPNHTGVTLTGDNTATVDGSESYYANSSGRISSMQEVIGENTILQFSLLNAGYISNTQFRQYIRNMTSANIKYGVQVGNGNLTEGAYLTGTFTGDATATAIQLLAGQIAYVKGVKVTGTMPNRINIDPIVGAINTTNPTVSVHDGTNPQMSTATVDGKTRFCMSPKTGYYTNQSSYAGIEQGVLATTIGLTADKLPKGQTVLGVDGTYTSDATAQASWILGGQTAYVKGVKVTGTMGNKASVATQTTPTLDTTNSRVSFAMPVVAYYDKGSSVYASYDTMATLIGLTAGKLAPNNTVLGVTGTYTSDATATAIQILANQTAYVNGVKVTGTMADRRNVEILGNYNPFDDYTDIGVIEHDTGGNYLGVITRPSGYSGYMDASTKIKTWITGLTKDKVQAGLTFGPSGGLQLTGTYTSDATATAPQILAGQTAYVNGIKVTGTMENKTTINEYSAVSTLDTTNSTVQMTIPAIGHYGTNNKLKTTYTAMATLIGLTAGKLVSGNTVLGITGTAKRYASVVNPSFIKSPKYYTRAIKYAGTASAWANYTSDLVYVYSWSTLTGGWIPSIIKVTKKIMQDGSVLGASYVTITPNTRIVTWEPDDGRTVDAYKSSTTVAHLYVSSTGITDYPMSTTGGLALPIAEIALTGTYSWEFTIECWE